MNQKYILIAIGIALTPFLLPALSGAGFILAGIAAVLLLIALLGGPAYWEFYKNKHMGSAGRKIDASDTEDTFRDVIGGNRTLKRRGED